MSRDAPIMLMASVGGLGGTMSRRHMEEQVWETVSIKSRREVGENYE